MLMIYLNYYKGYFQLFFNCMLLIVIELVLSELEVSKC
jgi:hypothetical protein